MTDFRSKISDLNQIVCEYFGIAALFEAYHTQGWCYKQLEDIYHAGRIEEFCENFKWYRRHKKVHGYKHKIRNYFDNEKHRLKGLPQPWEQDWKAKFENDKKFGYTVKRAEMPPPIVTR